MVRARRFASDAADGDTIVAIVRDAHPESEAEPPAGPLDGAESAFLAVSVPDLDAASDWYSSVLGLGAVREVASPDGSLRARVMSAGSVVVELVHHRASISPEDVLERGAHRFQLEGIVKAGLFVPDLDLLHEELRARGVDVDARIGTDEDLGLRFFVFRDRDGNRIQAFERRDGGCD